MDDGAGDPTIRERLIDGGVALVRSDGPGNLTVRRLAQAADRSTMCVYTKFGNRSALLGAIYDAAAGELLDGLDGADPAAAYRDFALTEPNLYRLLVEHPLDDLGVPSDRRRRLLADVLAALGQDERPDGAQRAWIELHGTIAWERIQAS
jgi:AcrR family transcriptional regulator